ncbi:MAG: hypothetical protein J6U03_03565 [Muribaculaceae bacterium]|nr:hypothetical protein [Muribaculaceae bacterium]
MRSVLRHIVLFLLPLALTANAGDYDSVEKVTQRMSDKILDAIEGVWQFTGEDGALVAIEKDPTTTGLPSYKMIVIDSPQRALLPGSVMAKIHSTVKPDTFEADIFTHFNLSSMNLDRPKKFILTLKNARLTIKPVKAKLSVNLLRLIPYAYRLGLSYRDHRPDDLDGCVRIFPVPPQPSNPVYL